MGALSYGKLRLEKEPKTNLCPCCGIKLVEVCQYGVDPVVPPDQYFEGFVSVDGWYPIKSDISRISNSHQFSPITELDDILQNIAGIC